MPLSPIRVPGPETAMEIRFCTICNESIPDGEFETGRAIQTGKRAQHVACGLKRAADMNGPSIVAHLPACPVRGRGRHVLPRTHAVQAQ